MVSLNELVYNIKNLAYGGKTGVESTMSDSQIKFWIHYHRAKIINELVQKNQNIDDFYQKAYLTTYSSSYGNVQTYISNYNKAVDNNTALPAITDGILTYTPKVASTGELTGRFIPYSSLIVALDSDVFKQSYTDSFSRSAYGIPKQGIDTRELRNKGIYSFKVPNLLNLKNDIQVKNITVSRIAYHVDDPATQDDEASAGYSNFPIKLHKTTRSLLEQSQHNKFFNHSSPTYLHEKTTSPSSSDRIRLHNLDVSPNYLGGDMEFTFDKVYWQYSSQGDFLLKDPTRIVEMPGFNWDYGPKEWNDHGHDYPIGTDYIGDLIQRILQIEINTTLKTVPEVINDGMDDTHKMQLSRGSQVQR